MSVVFNFDASKHKPSLDFREVKRRAVGCWENILVGLGVSSEYLKNKHGPCPGCDGKDRFRFADWEGKGTFVCGQGSSGKPLTGDGFALLQHVYGWDIAKAFEEVADYLRLYPVKPKLCSAPKSTQSYALQLRKEAQEDAASHPYAQAKGITWNAGARRHRSVTGREVGRNADCLVVPIRDIQTDAVVAVQAINQAGKKQSFGPIKGNGFICGNALDKSIPWFVVEGWADAVSLAFHHYDGNACAFAAFGSNVMDALAERVSEVYNPAKLAVVGDM